MALPAPRCGLVPGERRAAGKAMPAPFGRERFNSNIVAFSYRGKEGP